MSAIVGALRADLETNVAQFKSDMGAAGDAVDKTTGKMKKGAKEAEGASKSFEKFGKELKGAFALSAGVAIGAFIKQALEGAVATEEMSDALKREFGAMGESVEEWSEKTAKDLGRIDDELKEAAFGFGKLFQKVVPTQGAAADMSEAMTKLAVDIATFNRIPISEATDKLRAGLAGSTRGLKEFGILISEAEIKQRAVQMGLARTTDEVSAQDKVLASYNLILEKTTNLQGFAAQQAGTNAGKLRAFQARIDGLADTLGSVLLPILIRITEYLTIYAEGIRTLSGDTDDFMLGLQVAQARLTGGNVNEVVRKFREAKGAIDETARAAATNGGVIEDEFEGAAKTASELGAASRAAANDVKQANRAVAEFGVPDIPVSTRTLSQVGDAYVKLSDQIRDQVETLKEKTDRTQDETDAIYFLQEALTTLSQKYEDASKAAEALFMAEDAMFEARNAADVGAINEAADGLARAGGAMGASSAGQQRLVEIERDLARERLQGAVDLAEMEAARAQAILDNDDVQLERLNQVIAAQTVYGELLAQTTASQIDAQLKLQASIDSWQASSDAAVGDFFKDLRDTAGQNGGEIAANLIRSISDQVLEQKATELVEGLFGFLFGEEEKRQDVQTINAAVLNVASMPGAGGASPLGGIPIPGMDGGGGWFDGALQAAGDFFGGFFAEGGSLRPGEWGIAGENGIEILRGGAHGMEVDPDVPGGGPDVVNQTFVFPNANVDGFKQSRRQVAQMARRELAG